MASALIDIALLPGEYFVGDARHRIRTLLGSCVAIALWQPQRRVGALSHFLLPRCAAAHAGLDGHYGEEALTLMLRLLHQRGIGAHQCQAKVFGGGIMFPDLEHDPDCIGRQNVDAALNLLHGHGIPVVSQSVLGLGHRQIVFHVRSGDIWVRRGPQPDPAASVIIGNIGNDSGRMP
ncbi:MAG: chemotaxis protein CheD [Pseudomonadota bacterium]